MLRSRRFPLLLLVLLLTGVAAHAQRAEEGISMPEVRAVGAAATTIAIPEFQAVSAAPGIEPDFFRQVVLRDLALFSPIQAVDNPTLVARTHQRDLTLGRIDYEEWKRLGANFVLKGEYWVEAGRITLEVRLFDIDFRKQEFGYRYTGFAADQARRQAHRVSDEVRKSVFNLLPICNTQILFVSNRADGRSKEIWLMDADGHNKRQLTNEKTITATPCWGKNLTEVYYTTYKDYNPDLCGLQIASGRWWYISRRPNLNFAPSWNPRNERLALTLGRDGNSEIYTMDRSGKERTLKRLTYAAAIDSSPCWNPDGTRLVFTSSRVGKPQVFTMEADGSNVQRLTHHGNYNDAAVWSPVGDRIAYASRADGRFDIHLLDIDGGARRQLTANRGNNEDPSWAPDGEHLVFASDRTGEYQLYLMRADGGGQVQLTTEGKNQSPAWSPGDPMP